MIEYWCHKCKATVEIAEGTGKGIAVDCPHCGAKIFKLRPDSSPAERPDSPPAEPLESPPTKPPLRLAKKVPLDDPPVVDPVFEPSPVFDPPQANIPKSRPRRGVAKLIGVVVLAAAAASGWYYTRTPSYSLWKLHRAVHQHDLATFEKHFDVESAVSRFIDATVELAAESRSATQQGGWEKLGEGLVLFLKPQLTNLVKNYLYSVIETGKAPEKKEQSQPGEIESSLAKLLDTAGDKEKPSLSVAYIRKEGAIAYVGLDVPEEIFGSSQTAVIKMRDKGGYWQVSEFVNGAELVQLLPD